MDFYRLFTKTHFASLLHLFSQQTPSLKPIFINRFDRLYLLLLSWSCFNCRILMSNQSSCCCPEVDKVSCLTSMKANLFSSGLTIITNPFLILITILLSCLKEKTKKSRPHFLSFWLELCVGTRLDELVQCKF